MIKKTLVVNDDAVTLLVVPKLIQKAAFANETVTATNGEDALVYFENIVLMGKEHFGEVPDFIFLDINMPRMNGWEFLEIFSERYAPIFPEVKVAILSSSMIQSELLGLNKYGFVLTSVIPPINIEKLEIVKNMYLNQQFTFYA